MSAAAVMRDLAQPAGPSARRAGAGAGLARRALVLSDQPPFEQVVLPHAAALLRAARALTRSPTEARDLVQDTLERALRTYDRFATGSNARAWTMAILSRLFIDRWRKRRRQPMFVDIDCLELPAPAEEPLPDPAPAWEQLSLEDVRRAAVDLPLPLRRIFELSAFTRLSYGEISAVMGIPASTVGTRLLRARRRLRALLIGRAATAAARPTAAAHGRGRPPRSRPAPPALLGVTESSSTTHASVEA